MFKKKALAVNGETIKVYFTYAKGFLTKEYSINGIAQKVWATIQGWYSHTKEALIELLFERYYGVTLLRPRSVFLGYTLLLIILYGALFVMPDSLTEALSYINFTEQALSILIVLLTILLSAGLVLLGDDTRGWSLARMAIIRDVVKLRGLMLSCLVIIFVAIMPDYSYWGHTLKFLSSPMLIAAFIFILGIYFRIYLWLSDLAADPSFFDPQDPANLSDKGDDRSYISGSYRFARIMHLVHYLNARDAWQAIFEKKIPYGYEELLHEEFFKSAERIITDKKETMYLDLSVRLEIYDKYYKRRKLNSWRFYLEYNKRFLLMYSAVAKIVDADRADAFRKGLWRAKTALKHINQKLISDSMTTDGSWSSFEAIDAYLVDADLLYLGDRQNFKDDMLIKHFLNEYFDKVFKEELDIFHIESYFTEHSHWQITHKNLWEDRFNITFVFERAFKEWLFKQLSALKDKDGLYDVDSLFETHFAEADPITIADLYWLLYQAQGTTDSGLIVKLYYTNPRPFGLTGRTYITDGSDDSDVHREGFIAFQDEQIESAIKLFAQRYHTYFLRFWNLDELIETSQLQLDSQELTEEERIRLEHLNALLGKIKEYYARR